MTVHDLGSAAGANMEMKADLGDSARPFNPSYAMSLNLIRCLCVACRSGSWPRPTRLWEPGLLLALRPRYTHLELCRTHLSRRPGRKKSTSGLVYPIFEYIVSKTYKNSFFIRWTLWSSSWLRKLPAVAGREQWRSQEQCKVSFIFLVVLIFLTFGSAPITHD